MRIGIVGGRLQGIEAVYLCRKAGYESVLIDKDAQAPALTLANEAYILDITKDVNYAKKVLKKVDAVLPANENKKALVHCENLCMELGIPFMQDNAAFWTTSDKLRSAEFLLDLNIPTPKPWPDCGFPAIVKPSRKSGSESVFRANTIWQLQKALKKVRGVDEKIIIQEFIEGSALSLEVIAKKGEATSFQITGLEFDESYSCKRVYAPVVISADLQKKFNEIGEKIAKGLKLNGLTDVQAISREGLPIVNEINARLPSQTPTVVYHSSGVNMVYLLAELFLENELPDVRIQPRHAVIYQHIKVFDGELRVQGEHVMENVEGLQIIKNFCGANEAITNMTADKEVRGLVATLIVKAKSLDDVKKKMERVIQRIMNEYGLETYSDPAPSK
ncbi:MAG: 3-methylornithine--L-lysine ligase PylC [Candidatus Bathyarchaeota archaeon]|nr:3-methylornithine--L-lysine ligase PylC [Candidatus Bathyarchaeota archaeon]